LGRRQTFGFGVRVLVVFDRPAEAVLVETQQAAV